jgi:signal transduction histidine kinase
VPTTGFHEVARLSPDAMLLLARDGTILAANSAAEASLSSSGERIVGLRLADLSADTADYLDAYLGRCARSGDPLPGAMRLRAHGGAGLRVRTWGARGAHRGALAAGSPATIALRLQPDGVATAELVLLNHKIEELGREIVRRRAIEQELRDREMQLREELAGRRAAEDAADRLSKLQTLTTALLRVSDFADVAEAAVAHAPVALGTTSAVLFVESSDGSMLDLVGHAGLAGVPFRTQLSVEERWPACAAARTGEPQWIEALQEAVDLPPSLSDIRDRGASSAAALPLWGAAGHVIGVLGLGFRGPDRLPQSERSFALTIADLCAHAVDRALVLARADRAARFVAQLESVTASFSQALTPADVAEVVVRQGCTAIGGGRGAVWLLANETDEIEMLATVGFAEEVASAYRRIPLARAFPVTDVVRSAAALYCESSAALFARYPSVDFLQKTSLHAVAAIPLKLDAEVIGVLAFVFDEPRRFEPDLRAFVGELASKCAHALDRARLYETAVRARFDAEVANRARNDFLSTVSHELRTPLTAVLGWASILRARAREPDVVTRGLMIIERNARAQSQLIEDILDVSRMATGKLRLEVSVVDAAAIVQAAVDLVQPAAEARGVAIEVMVDPAVGCFAADPARFQQIAGNLLSNAVKFTPRGGRVFVRLDRLSEHVRLRVTDTGQGIAPDLLPHVFDQFRQGESHSTRSYGGLGLGLAIVKHLVELHDGTIVAESAGPGQGATLTVTLALSPRAAELHPASVSDPPTPALLRLDGVRVLIVDDNTDTREMIATVLQEQGAVTAVAGSAAEALASVIATCPNVLVSDVGMPDEDGYSLLRKLRALGPIPAIALTAYAGAQDARMAELAGFDRHLAKPIAPARLVEAVARLVASSRSVGGA